MALTADTGRDFCTLPSPQRVCAHSPDGGPLGQPPAVWHLTYEESRARAHPPPGHPHPREEPGWRGGLTTSRKQDPQGPDLFTMCPVAFDGNSIAPFVLSQRPGGGERSRKVFFFFLERRPGGGSWGLGWVPFSSTRPGLGISSGVHRQQLPFQAPPPCLLLKEFPGFASCHPQHLMWAQILSLGLFFLYLDTASLLIHPSIHSTESIKNLLCARHCPRCLDYDRGKVPAVVQWVKNPTLATRVAVEVWV